MAPCQAAAAWFERPQGEAALRGRPVRATVVSAPLPSRRKRHVVRRIGVATVVILALNVAMPVGPAREKDPFPLSWLAEWFHTAQSWAKKDPPVPVQPRGSGTSGNFVDSARAPGVHKPVAPAAGELPPYTEHRTGGTQASGPADEGFNATTSKAAPDLTTPTIDSFRNADGTVTRRMYERPVNYRRADGSWAKIDSTLATGGDRRPTVVANSFQLSFAAGARQSVVVDGVQVPSAADRALPPEDLVRLVARPGVELAYSLRGATLNRPKLAGNVVTYRDALPNVDVELQSQASGMKETLWLRSAQAPVEYLFPLRLTGLTARIAANGGVEFVDAAGAVTLTMPPGFMEDSAFDASGAGATSYGVKYDVVDAEGGPAIRMSIDATWLRDPARRFPVGLDPGVFPMGTSGDTYGLSSSPTTVQAWENNIAVGTWNAGGQKARSFIGFSGMTSLYGMRITRADLNLYLSYQGNGTSCVGRAFTVHAVTAPWDYGTMTWNSMPPVTAALGSSSPSSSTACNNSSGNRSVGVWTETVLDLGWMNDWATGGNVHGLSLQASESDSLAWKRFTSSNYTANLCAGRSCAPYLEITWSDNASPQIDTQYPANNSSLDTLTPQLAAKGHDTDGWPNKGLRYKFRVLNDKGADIHTSGWTTGQYRVPAGVLEWGKVYLYTAVVDDYSSSGPAQPLVYAFTTQVPQPPITSALAQNGGKGFEPSVGNFTTSETDAQIATTGPALAVNRDYNSLDTRAGNAFGRGWSSTVDMHVRENHNADGIVETATVRYPNGQEVNFGRNNNGTWVSPAGRFSVFTKLADNSAYTLTDKDGTTYEFGRQVSGQYWLTKITDSSQRSLTVSYNADGRAEVVRSAASDRTLTYTWVTPSGAGHPHVATVTTNRSDPADPNSAQTWTYTYAQDKLVSVCPPGTTTACATYEHRNVAQYQTTVLQHDPYSFWRLNETGGEVARSSVLSNDGTDDAAASDLTYGVAGPLGVDSASTAAGFNGTSSRVKLPVKAATESGYQTISLWFKTTAAHGVLFSFQRDNPTPGTTTPGNYNPALYVDTNGRLRGSFWHNSTQTTISNAAVNDGQWHHAVLSGNGGSQQLFVDGAAQGGPLNGTIVLHEPNMPNVVIGAGYTGGGWPGTGLPQGSLSVFNGSIADVAYFNRALNQHTVDQLWAARFSVPEINKVTSNAGRVRSAVAYDLTTGRVSQVTDENGGVWKLGRPTNSGSSQVYASSVLGSRPRDYFRFADPGGTVNPVNQVASNYPATYHNVTFTPGAAGAGPFPDSHGANFNGSSSRVRMFPLHELTPTYGPQSIELWFKIPAGHNQSGVLYAAQDEELGTNPTAWTPSLYVGGDGKLRGGYWDGQAGPMTSSVSVNDGQWHHVVLTGTYEDNPNVTAKQVMYLDNVVVGSKDADQTSPPSLQFYSYIGAGHTQSWPGATSNTSYFNGSIAEFAYYNHALTQQQVDAHFKGSRSSLPPPEGVTTPVLTPVTTVTVTDPADQVTKRVYDTVNGNRIIAEIDPLGNATSYGYDVGGFTNVVYDPLGGKTETGKDARGNTVRTTTCGFYPAEVGQNCQTTYYKYWPDPAPAQLTPDPRNDQLIEVRQPVSSLEAYLGEPTTKLAYDTAGNRTTVTTPAVPGFPTGRVTTTTYTTATTPAVGQPGDVTPAGLPTTVTSAGNRTQTTEYNRKGDAVHVRDPAGLDIWFDYDDLGRVTSKRVVSTAHPAGQVTRYRYDGEGQLVEVDEPAVTNAVTGAQHTSRTVDTYDADGNVLTRTIRDLTGGDADRVATNSYNAHGQVIKTTDPAGSVSVFSYDALGRQTKVVDCDSSPAPGVACPSGDVLRTTQHTFNELGLLKDTTVIGADGTSTRVTFRQYHRNGTLATETDAMGWVTRYEYYPNGKVKKVVRDTGQAGPADDYVLEENSYDQAGNLWSRTENNGKTVRQFAVDGVGRVHTESVRVDGTDRTTNYLYDIDDRVVTTRKTVAAAGGGTPTVLQTVRRGYDPMGNVLSEGISTDGAGGPVGWWKLNETTTPGQNFFAFDSSASAAHVSGWSGVTMDGSQATFTGGGDGFLSGPNVLDTTSSYSVAAWVNIASLPAEATIVGQGGVNRSAFHLRYSQGRWEFSSPAADTAASASRTAFSPAAVQTNTWVHLVGVFDSGTKTMAVYVNGAKGTDAANPTPFATTGGLGIGGVYTENGSSGNFAGQLDNVQVYQRALTGAEVNTLRTAGRGSDTTAATGWLTTNYQVDNLGLTTSSTDPMGNRTDFEYDQAGRLVTSVAPSVQAETFGGPAVAVRPVSRVGYNTFGEVVEQQDPLGRVTTTRVDAAGRPVQTILPDYTPPGGTTIAGASSGTTYDKLGQVVATTDPRNKTTTYGYDAMGNRTSVTGPTGKVSTAAYNKVGDLVEAVDPTGARTTATYDHLGRQLTTSQVVRQPSPVTHTTTYSYTNTDGTDSSWARRVTSPTGVATTVTYNELGEARAVTDGANNTTSTVYDGLGRAAATIRADGSRQTMVYDGAGRVTEIRDHSAAAGNPVVRTVGAGYDDNGNATSIRDGRGTTSTFSFDALGRPTAQRQPKTATADIVTTFGYDAAGNRTRFTDGRGHPFWTTYNAWGLPESQIEPATAQYPNAADRTFTVAYDAAGRPVTQAMPGGVSITNTYDDLNRLTGQAGAGAEAATGSRTFGYDDAGRLTSLSTPASAITVDYDDRSLPLSITSPYGNSAYTYNGDGNTTERVDDAGTTTFTYDVAGRTRTVQNATTGLGLTIDYNTLSLPSKATYGTQNNYREFGYDALQRLSSDTLKTSGGTAVAGITYGYDLNDNLSSKVTTGVAGAGSNTYHYDLADRLTGWTAGPTTTTYAYDDSGNRTQAGAQTFTYDERNQLLTQSGGTTYQYSPRGTLRQAGSFATESDAFGQVVTQQAAGGASTTTYDALGRALRAGFKYSGLGNTLSRDSGATYTRGAAGELIGVGPGAGAGSRYAWTDQHGDVVGQFSATGAALLGSTTYDPLGRPVASAGMSGSLGYQGEWTDTVTGRVNMHARWYNTDTGQFDTRDTASNDPMPNSVAANRFQYGDANPMTTADPTGHWGIKLPSFKSVVKAVTAPVRAVAKAVSTAYTYVASGQAWKDIKSAASWAADKAKKAWTVVKDTTTKWAKNKVNAVKDAYNSAKNCVASGVGKCVTETAKKAAKSVTDTVRNTVEAVKQDPWKYLATAVAAAAAAAAVAAICATGVGCLILAGAVAGAAAAGAGYMTDVARGDQKFSWSGLASTMIEGGLDGALSAGTSRAFPRLPRLSGPRSGNGGADGPSGGGNRSNADTPSSADRPSSGGDRPSAGGGRPPTGGGSPSRPTSGGGSGQGRGSAGGPDRGNDRPSCSCSCQLHSFAPGTLVLLADGSAVPIEDIKLGDEVVATDPETGEAGARPVTNLHLNVDTHLTRLTVADAATGEQSTLETTRNHPFWDATTGEWVEAGKLTPGHRLLVHDEKRLEGDGSGAGSGGGGPPTEVVVVEAHNHTGSQVMHDLTVAGIHTYYVLAGDDPVLVHNNLPCQERIDYASDGLSRRAYEARDGVGYGAGRNVAVAHVPGFNHPLHGDYVYGFSRGNDIHSEDGIIGQLDSIVKQLEAKGLSGKVIKALYSERSVCDVCAPKIAELLADGARVTYSVPHGPGARNLLQAYIDRMRGNNLPRGRR